MSADPMLELQGVHSGYGPTTILRDISLHVREGEVISLIGRNGVGKTTTLRTIMGILEPHAGTITYRGSDITDLNDTETAKIGIGLVPEERRIFPRLSVMENLRIAEFGGSESGDALSIDEVLDMFDNLRDRTENQGSALSGGEQQMLTIARALVGGADLILLDEPTEGLAPYIVQDVIDVIADLADRGKTVLLVEQNVYAGLEVADRNYLIDQGQIVFEGTSPELEAREDLLQKYLGATV